MAVVHGLEHFYTVAIPVTFTMLRNELGLTYIQLGFLVSLRGFFGILQPLAGYLSDRWGARILLVFSCLIMSLSFLGLASSSMFIMLLFFQFIQALGSVAIHPSSYSLVAKFKSSNMVGRKMALHALGGNLGTIIGLVVIAAISSLLGWRSTFLLLSLPGIIIVFLLHKTSFFITEASSEIGEGKKEDRKEEKEKESGGISPVDASINLFFPLLVLGLAVAFQGMFKRSLSSFLPTFLYTVYGSGVAAAGMLSALLYVGGIIGLLVGGELADRVDRVYLIAVTGVIITVFLLVVALVELPEFLLIIVLIFLGFVQHITSPAKNALTSELSYAGKEGSSFGLIFGLSFVGGAVASPLAGFLADIIGMRFAFMYISLVALLMVFTILVLKKWGFGSIEGRSMKHVSKKTV